MQVPPLITSGGALHFSCWSTPHWLVHAQFALAPSAGAVHFPCWCMLHLLVRAKQEHAPGL